LKSYELSSSLNFSILRDLNLNLVPPRIGGLGGLNIGFK
jgi:hypothetical protein